MRQRNVATGQAEGIEIGDVSKTARLFHQFTLASGFRKHVCEPSLRARAPNARPSKAAQECN